MKKRNSWPITHKRLHLGDSNNIAPKKYNPNFHPQYAYNLFSQFGFTKSQVASAMGIMECMLIQWIKKHSEFAIKCQQGMDEYNTNNVEGALLRCALGDEIEIVEHSERVDKEGNIYNLKNKKVVIIPPSSRACMSWLRNRSPERWPDNRNQKIEGTMDHTHSIDVSKCTDQELRTLHGIYQRQLEEKREKAVDVDYREEETG